MEAIQGLYNPKGRAKCGKWTRHKADRPGDGIHWIGAVPTAAMLNGAPPTEIFPTDSEKGWRDWKGRGESGEVEHGEEEGGAFRSLHSMTKPILRLPFTFTALFTTYGKIAKTP